MSLIKSAPRSRIELKGIPTGIIYHYTNAKAFINIMKSASFHLNHYKNLKDENELVKAANAYHETIAHLFPPNLNFAALMPENFYVFCACLRNNNKYLWDNYASENQGDYKGLLIGIDAESLYDYYSRQLDQIHMTPMNYDWEQYIRICKESVEGLDPVDFAAGVAAAKEKDVSKYNEEQREEFFAKIIGYNAYRAKRSKPLGELTMQKGSEYSKEEEVRIVHWPEVVNQPMRLIQRGSKTKAVMPWVIKGEHLIKEIIVGPNCKLHTRQVGSILKKAKIRSKITKADDKNFE